MKPYIKRSFQIFANLKLAILLLLLIASISIVGTIIEQNQSIEFYQQNYSTLLGKTNTTFGNLIISLGLDHVYTNFGFITLLISFGISLVSCTFFQQFPILKNAKKYNFQFKTKEFNKQTYKTYSFNNDNNRLLYFIKKNDYTIFQQSQNIYAYKGIIGRFAPIIVHGSMIMILIGTLIASISGFQSQEFVPKGEIIQPQNIVTQNIFTKIPNKGIRMNDFWIEYGNKKNTQQFYSNISLIEYDGRELKNQTIRVNDPLRWEKLTIYQTDWGIQGLRIKKNNNIFQIPSKSINKNTWISLVKVQNDKLIIIYNNLEGVFQIFSQQGENLGTYIFNQPIRNNQNSEIKILDYVSETGLQIKADPGIPIIYLGFGLLMISTILSYLSYNQYWLKKQNPYLIISGQSNRAKLNFIQEFINLQKLTKNTNFFI